MVSMTGDYTIKDVAKVLGIDRGRAADWLSRGYIKPSVPSTHQGVAARFSRYDIIMAALFKKLVDRGFDRDDAAEHVMHLVTGHHNIDNVGFAMLCSVPDNTKKGYSIYSMYVTPGEVPPLLSELTGTKAESDEDFDYDMLIVLDFKTIRKEVDKRLKEL